MSYVSRASFVGNPGFKPLPAQPEGGEAGAGRTITSDDARRMPLEDLFRFCYGDGYRDLYDTAVNAMRGGRHPTMVRIDVIEALRNSGRVAP